MENIYYCYAYLDTRKPGKYIYGNLEFEYEPFYIGKGKEKRADYHLTYVSRRLNKGFNHHFHRKIKKILLQDLKPEIVLIRENMMEEEAYKNEEDIINLIGLKNLSNVFLGGKGGRNNKNFSGKSHSEESKKKMSLSHLGIKNPMYGEKWFRSVAGIKSFSKKTTGKNHHLYNKHRSEEVKVKISNKLLGIKWNDCENKKRSEGMKIIWKKRKKNNIKIENKGTSKPLSAINEKTKEIIHFETQKECSTFFKMDFRTIKNRKEKNISINNYKLSWILDPVGNTQLMH